MAILFGAFWLIASIIMSLIIRGNIFKSKEYYKTGLALIILSFVFGFTLLVVVLLNT